MSEINPTKQCAHCREIKALDLFYKRSKNPKPKSICKKCEIKRINIWRQTERGKASRVIERKKWQGNNPHYDAQYRKTASGKLASYKAWAIQWKTHRQRILARQAVIAAVRRGTMIRPDKCSLCGIQGKIESHHFAGYSLENRFDVVWLCIPCHKSIHQEIKQRASALNPARFSENTLKDIL